MLAVRAGRQIALAITAVALLVMEGGVCQNTAPAISLHPTGGVHIQGDPVTLSCRTTTEVSSIEWFKDDQLLGSGPQFSIASFSESQAGNYTCRTTTNGVGTVTSAIARLQLAALEASPPGTFNAPYSEVAQYNQPWVLSCGNLTSIPTATYNWDFQNSIPFIERDHAIIGKNDGLLYLQLVTETPPTFVCTVYNPHIAAYRTGSVQLTVQGNSSSSSASPQVMMSAPQDTVAVEGDTVSFQCIVGGHPVLDIEWTHPNETQTRLSQQNAILSIIRVTTADAGQYACYATGLGRFIATLTVLVPPVISTPFGLPQSPIFGDPLTLSCSVSNTLVREWVWYHNGVPLPVHADTSNTLVIDTVDTSHGGLYQCFAYNAAGNDSSVTSINVTTIPAKLTETIQPPSSLVFEGSDISYSCKAHGAPPPSILWLHNGIPMDIETTSVNPETREATSSVELSGVRQGDSGQYVCRAVNQVGGVEIGSQETQATLVVIVPTVIITPTQRLYTLDLDKPGVLTCQAAQDGAELGFTWEKDGVQLVPDGIRVSLSTENRSTTLLFSNVVEEDSGIYQCKVTTSFGGITGPSVESIPINVTASPAAPVSRKTTAIYEKAWFIAIACVVCVVVVLALFLAFVGRARLVRKRRQKYSVRSRDEVETMKGRHARSLTEEEMADYNGRASRRSGGERSELSVGLALDGRESESSAGEKYPYKPSLSTTVSHSSSQAPACINPPPFEEAIRRLHTSRLTRAYSNSGSSTLKRPPPSTTYSSPLPPHSLTPSQPHPPPPSPVPQSPTHSEHKYTSVKELGHNQRSEGMRMMSHLTTPTPTPNGYVQNANGYDVLPTTHMAHEMYLRPRTQHMLQSSAQNMHVITQPALAKTSTSQPNLATLV